MVTKGEKRIKVVETRMTSEDWNWFKLTQVCPAVGLSTTSAEA